MPMRASGIHFSEALCSVKESLIMGFRFSARAFDELNYSTMEVMVKYVETGEFTRYAKLYVLETSIAAATMKVQEYVGTSGTLESVVVIGTIRVFESIVGRQVTNPDEEPPYVAATGKL